MAEVYEWHFGDGGVQLLDDSTRAGNSMLTVIVPDLEASRAALQSRQLSLGPSSGGDFARIAQIAISTAIKLHWRSPVRRSGRKHQASQKDQGPNGGERIVAELFLQISVSLEGYIEDRHRDIEWMTSDTSFDAFITATLPSIDGMIFGRTAHALLAASGRRREPPLTHRPI